MAPDYPVISRNPREQAFYEECRRAGTPHNLAEMFALRAAPRLRTDSTFLAGHCNGSQFQGQEHIGDHYKAVAAEAGVNVTGKVYKSGLARFPGDPEAWVGGRGDVQRVCEERGWACDGDVKVKARDVQNPIEDVDVAPDLVEQRVLDKLVADPDLVRTADPGEVWHAAKEEIKPHWHQDGLSAAA